MPLHGKQSHTNNEKVAGPHVGGLVLPTPCIRISSFIPFQGTATHPPATMTTAKLHPSLPAPVVHASYLSTSRSKSHVLAGVQDAYWSDDEAVNSHILFVFWT